ncbi:hypothetical protein [Streptosporangium saharense]|uniref:hypothetical protein n=1 Tax=Streptosporangium saharense TaxID=1706840 RepID=UPI0033172D40
MGTAGRDGGSFGFEVETLVEHVGVHLDVLGGVGEIGRVRVGFTDLTGGSRRTALRERVLDRLAPEHPGVAFGFDDGRVTGRGYYVGAAFGIDVTTPEGEVVNVGDGGFTTWTGALLGNAKERLLVSGLGVERLCGLMRPSSQGESFSERRRGDPFTLSGDVPGGEDD